MTVPYTRLSPVPGKAYSLVQVACPFCGLTHQHGWSNDEPEPGLRSSHCHKGGCYRITVPTT